MRTLFRIRNARIYLLGDVVSTLGDSALWLAMAIWIKELTGSSAAAGLVMFFFTAGSLCSPLGGVLADRFRRRPILIWANLAAAAVVLLISLVHDRGQIWLVYLVMLAYGMIGSAIAPAQTALLPALVPADLLAEANGAQQTLNEGLRIITPLAGAGLLVLLGGPAVAVIDAVTFGVAVLSLIALRVDEPRPARAAGPRPRGELTAGFRFLRDEPVLRAITIALALALLVIGFTESAIFSVVTVGLHDKAAFVGVLSTIQGVGAVAGGLSAARLLKRLSEVRLTALGLACGAGGVLLLTLPSLAAVIVGLVLAGFASPWILVAAVTAIQRRTPAAVLGRVSGAFGLLSVPQVVSVGLGAALIAVLSYRVLLLTVAVVVAAAATFLMTQSAARPQAARRPGPS
ncbi:MAG TPA: MFS transporter [Streptosporangiaceae bacterium]|jgi:MFS family permease|nr:MFS transporter [Streptosporangiaceae bacterium]